MTFPRYPRYKDSGVVWLGEVPAHWCVAPIGSHYSLRSGYPFSAELFEPEGDPADRLIRIRNIMNPHSRIFTSEPCPEWAIVKDGDVLVGMDGDFNVIYWNAGRAKLNQRVCALRGENESLDRYLFYGLPVPLKITNDLTFSTTVKHLSSGQLLKLRFPRPPSFEVAQIVAFLDHETGKIDALIEEQRRLIDLLKEKRQAVISHAVTKGLDPNVPMKDSGVEWLGEVPAHWEVKKVSYLFRARKGEKGALLTKAYCDEHAGSFPVYSGQTENQGILGYLDWYELDLAEDGGILATTVGANAMSLSFVSGRLSLSQNCMVIMPVSPEAFARFYFYHFQPLFKRERNMIPDHMQPSFRMDDLYSFYIALPPATEQREIATYLDATSGRAEGLLQSATRAIELLRERRSALISAAVTGKIDVRGWSAGAKSEEPELAMVAEEPAGYSAQGGSA